MFDVRGTPPPPSAVPTGESTGLPRTAPPFRGGKRETQFPLPPLKGSDMPLAYRMAAKPPEGECDNVSVAKRKAALSDGLSPSSWLTGPSRYSPTAAQPVSACQMAFATTPARTARAKRTRIRYKMITSFQEGAEKYYSISLLIMLYSI